MLATLPFDSKFFVFLDSIYQQKDYDRQSYNFACRFVWEWISVSHFKAST
jgi:hypothetical protein